MINRKRTLPWKRIPLIGFLFVLMPVVYAQELKIGDLPPGLREQALVMNISARIVEGNQEIVWDSEDSRVTINGRAVGLKLVGANIVVEVMFTPYLNPGRNVLLAQGTVVIDVPRTGASVYSIMETIPLVFDEKIFFFPLGSAGSKNEALIEIQLVVHRYSE